MLLKGKRLQDMEIERNTIMQLLAIPKSQFQKCFGQWKDHRNKCVVSEGDYFEGGYDCNTTGHSPPSPWSGHVSSQYHLTVSNKGPEWVTICVREIEYDLHCFLQTSKRWICKHTRKIHYNVLHLQKYEQSQRQSDPSKHVLVQVLELSAPMLLQHNPF